MYQEPPPTMPVSEEFIESKRLLVHSLLVVYVTLKGPNKRIRHQKKISFVQVFCSSKGNTKLIFVD